MHGGTHKEKLLDRVFRIIGKPLDQHADRLTRHRAIRSFDRRELRGALAGQLFAIFKAYQR